MAHIPRSTLSSAWLRPAGHMTKAGTYRLQPRQSAASARPARRHSELVPHESPAAAVQDRRAPHSACPVLHPAARRKLLDTASVSADRRAHRATHVAPDVIGRTAQAGSRIGAGGGVSEMCSHGQQAFAARDVSGRGGPRTARGTYREWAEWLGGTSRGPLTSPEEKRTWSISQIPVDCSWNSAIRFAPG